ncbi:DUF805 domain-containing protein [Alteraurantiacibacter aquimixticola]|uniref:DUF805 domain-containing protein n=1 Tax=Alteraurantiacibacter aquimixticola TaxID=2489173 RepID=A0A4V4U8V4_9SPHN|nr:DUF805 domain-containing protein [Alteraurantiacibacter aquimixticola]TIX51417.1 DUF805 domain-containing protein [Alteraurantiacibacter aquimixticola]
MDYMLLPLQRYADFSGRSRRMEYWMFVLFQILLFAGLFMVAGLFGAFDGSGSTLFIVLSVIVGLGLIIPGLAVQVRRLHDQDRSGWLVLVGFIPYIGGIILLVLMCLDGTPGENRYGPDPKGRGGRMGDVFS